MLRRLLLVCAVCVALGGSAGTARSDSSSSLTGNPIVVDVVVVGAGTGGTSAAIQAARLGSRVALLEQTDGLGGQMAAAGVTSIDSFRFDFRSGIFGEFLAGVESVYANDPFGPRPMGTCYFGPGSSCFEPRVGQGVLKGMLDAEPNLSYYPRTRVTAVSTVTDPTGRPVVTGVTAERLGATLTFQSKVLIDASETSYVLPLTPARYRAGNTTSPWPDPNACIDNVTYVAAIRKYANGVPPELVIRRPPGTDYDKAAAFFRTQVHPDGSDDGSLPWSWRIHNVYRGMPDSTNPDLYDASGPPSNWDRITRTGVNFANDFAFKVGDLHPANQFASNCRAKMFTTQFLYYMQTEGEQPLWSVANDEGYNTAYNLEQNNCPAINANAVESHLPLFPYYRESLRLIGLHTLTASEIFRVPYPGGYRARTHFPSSVALGDYAVDLHGCFENQYLEASLGESLCDLPDINPTDNCGDGQSDPCHRCRFGYFVGGPFQVPFESFVPETVDGLLAGDKNISVSRLAGGAVRLQPSTMLVGQAAGAIAGLAVRHHVQPRQVPHVLVQDALVRPDPLLGFRLPASVSIYKYADVPRVHPNWAGVQMVSTREVLAGNGVDTFFVNREMIRAEGAVVTATLRGLPLQPCTGAFFQDVPPSHFACRHIEALARAQLTAGCAANLFCPDAVEPRAQVAVHLVQAMSDEGSPYSPTPHFSDVPASNPYFRFVQIAYEKGYLLGCRLPGQFCPDDTVRRGDLADDVSRTMVAKALTQVPAP